MRRKHLVLRPNNEYITASRGFAVFSQLKDPANVLCTFRNCDVAETFKRPTRT